MGNEASTPGQGKKIPNSIELKWSKSAKSPFVPREGQAACSIGDKLYIFGGVVFNHDDGHDTEANDLIVYDTSSHTWTKEIPSKDCEIPSPRSGACLVSVGQSLYLFGGLSQFSGWMNDFYQYDTVAKTWHQLSSNGAPSPRDKVLSCVVDNLIYVFGGFGPVADDSQMDTIVEEDDGDDEYEDINELQQTQEAANFTWSNELFCFNTVDKIWNIVKPANGLPPSPRAAHSFSSIVNPEDNEKYLFVFGGRDSVARQNDLWRFTISSQTWEKVNAVGCYPEARSFHSMVSVGHRLVVHGGRGVANQHFDDINVFDSKTNQWLQPSLQNESEAPPAVGLHNMVIVGDNVVIFGGTSTLDPATGTCTKFFNDVFTLKSDLVLKGDAIAVQEEDTNTVTEKENMPAMLNLKPNQSTVTKPVVAPSPSSSENVSIQ